MNTTLEYQLTAILSSAFNGFDQIVNNTPVEEENVFGNITTSSFVTGSDVIDEPRKTTSSGIIYQPLRTLTPPLIQPTPEVARPNDVMPSIFETAVTTLLMNDVTSDVTGGGSHGNGTDGMPLWLPYVIITVVMLFLVGVSFARFHVVRGYQYRNRHQSSGDDRKDSSSITPSFTGGAALSNGSTCRSGAVSGLSATPEYLTMFLEFSRDEEEDRKGSIHRSDRRKNVGRLHSVDLTGNRRSLAMRQPKRTRSADLQTSQFMTSSKRSNGTGTRKPGSSSKRPLAYTFNVNGSMVDIRCSDDERTKTFRLLDNNDVTTRNGCNRFGASGTSVVGGTVLTGDGDEEDSVVIVVAADDYVDDYETNCDRRPQRAPPTLVTSRGGGRYYNNNISDTRPPRLVRQLPETVTMMTSPGVMSYSVVRSMLPNDDFRSPGNYQSKRI